jgi:CHAT domain-containing protein
MGDDDYKATRDPLLNSGLLLANAQQGISGQIVEGEDGILTAKEALNLTLDKTQLVVMSACETGRGEIRNGEGVYGLQRAFQQAGARTVLISLWKVSDEATQVLMTNFYENLLSKKLNKREAFLQAQSELMKKYPQPYYWGAFVMVGE